MYLDNKYCFHQQQIIFTIFQENSELQNLSVNSSVNSFQN